MRLIALSLVALVAASAASAAGGQLVQTRSTAIGTVLANKAGRTLYLRASDSKTKSTCYGSCALAWPPLLTTGKPLAGSGASAKLLGTLKRSDGKLQVTYKGHPLYLYSGDGAKGEIYGQGMQKLWWAVAPSGAPNTTAAPAATIPDYGSGGY